MPHVLIVNSPYYEHVSEELVAGAVAALEEAGATYDQVNVPGVLEVPAAVSMAYYGENSEDDYDGFVVLGCVIRGETTHYDIVANESARALMKLVVEEALAVGNGILTVENEAQALTRAKRTEKDKGGDAARATLAMIELKERFGA